MHKARTVHKLHNSVRLKTDFHER